ncbi:hypothetical protein GGR50DRAFT_624887 [Xylaria sp. CBS 124048]|nr:hypothetical protein GGR50DRAFT_624887 [Xylaria sp. CBS 124048]
MNTHSPLVLFFLSLAYSSGNKYRDGLAPLPFDARYQSGKVSKTWAALVEGDLVMFGQLNLGRYPRHPQTLDRSTQVANRLDCPDKILRRVVPRK